MQNKKFILIQALRTQWDPPPINTPWNNHADMNMSRILQCKAYHIDHFDAGQVPMDADVYIMCSFDIGLLEREIEMCKKLKAFGKKIVVGFSADLRFLIGNCLLSPGGTLYTELLPHVDLILSGLSPDLHVYGRYQDKVIPFGVTFERNNFCTIPFEQRPIDLLVSSSLGEECIAHNLEILLMIKERHPEIKIVYNTIEGIMPQIQRFKDRIEFVNGWLCDRLKYAKYLINPELRPKSGRCLVDSFYFRVPFISSEWAYHSRLCPDFTFSAMNMDYIANLFDKMLNSDYTKLVHTMENQAEFDYFDNFYPRMMKRLFPDE